jgi:hypothetical protein
VDENKKMLASLSGTGSMEPEGVFNWSALIIIRLSKFKKTRSLKILLDRRFLM